MNLVYKLTSATPDQYFQAVGESMISLLQGGLLEEGAQYYEGLTDGVQRTILAYPVYTHTH